MALQAIHDKLDDIPEKYRELYTEKGGKFELTGIAGVKTQADVDRLTESLRKEREEHKASKEKLKIWDGLEHSEVIAKLDRIPELEAAAKGKLDEAKIEEMVERRVTGTLKSRLAPVERENKTLKESLAAEVAEKEKLVGERVRRQIHDALRAAATELKVLSEAQEDILLLGERVFEIVDGGKIVTRDGVGFTPGIDPKSWLGDMQPKRPHWWPASLGTGSRGSGNGQMQNGANPWARDTWNLTEQGKVLKSKGREVADRMAASAGTKVGGVPPAKK